MSCSSKKEEDEQDQGLKYKMEHLITETCKQTNKQTNKHYWKQEGRNILSIRMFFLHVEWCL